MPSALAASAASWSGEGTDEASARVSVGPETLKLHLQLDKRGALERIQLSRWGNPGGTPHRYVTFGGIVEEERSFAGYTVPVQMRAGWYFGTDRFDTEGEFFRVTVQSAEYR